MRRLNIVIQENPMCNNPASGAHCPARMRFFKCFGLGLLLLTAILLPSAGRPSQSNVFGIALSDNIKTIDPIGSPSGDGASERWRTLIFDSPVNKDEKFGYPPYLACNTY